MYTVTLGEVLPVIGSFGNHLDYTVRLKLRLRDKIDDLFLKEAVEKTRQRYPYLCVHMKKDNENYFYVKNRVFCTLGGYQISRQTPIEHFSVRSHDLSLACGSPHQAGNDFEEELPDRNTSA